MKMKKRLLIGALAIVLLCSSSKIIIAKEVSNLNVNIEKIQGNKSNNINMETFNLNIDTNYVKLEDIKASSISEIKLKTQFPYYKSSVKIQELTDGYMFASLKKYEEKSGTSNKKEYYLPIIQKFNKLGELIWEKQYENKINYGHINNLIVFKDNSFLFYVNATSYWQGGQYIEQSSLIVKCDKDGNIQWKKNLNDLTGEMIQHIFINEAQDILIVGEWMTKDGKSQVSKEEYMENEGFKNIVITKLDMKGKIVNQKSLGGFCNNTLQNANYVKDLGIIIKGNTRPNNSNSFAIRYGEDIDFIACVNEYTLDNNWVYHLEEKYSFRHNKIFFKNNNIYVVVPGETIYNKKYCSVKIINRYGKELKTIKINNLSSMWQQSIELLGNNDIIFGFGNSNNNGSINIFDSKGKLKKKIENLKFSPNKIIPTNDGGFIVKSNRQIKTIPQPAVISSIWYDCEVVIVKYDSNYNLQWRKTYDSFKNSTLVDYVYPFNNGKVIINN
jgi:copper chaperone CopZ